MKNILLIIFINIIFSSDWSVDTTSSYIKYIGNHRLHQWEGISRDINFKLECNEECKLYVSLKLETLNSGNDSRDSNMLYYTESLLFPNVSFVSDNFFFNGSFDRSIDINGILDFHGVKKNIPLKITLLKEDNEFWGECKFKINLEDYNIERPSLLMIKINNEIKIESKFKIIPNL